MKDLQGKQIDEFFRKGLADPDIPFQEEHWYVLQEELEKRQKRKKVIAWWTRAGGIAAMLVMGLFIWNSQKPINTNKAPEVAKVKPVPAQPGIAQSNAGAAALPLSPPILDNSFLSNKSRVAKARISQNIPSNVETMVAEVTPAVDPISEISLPKVQPSLSSERVYIPALTANVANRPKLNPKTNFENTSKIQSGDRSRLSLSAMPDSNTDRSKNDNDKSKNDKSGFKPSLALTFIASPDVNGVNSLTNSRVGTNAGFAIALGVSPRLSVSTGVVYAKKVYKTDFSYYNPNTTYKFPVTPEAVNADCRVLDIPLNFSYSVWNKNNNMIQVIAGTSSYIMLDEKYNYSYQDPTSKGPRSYQVKNQNKHYFGIINLAANFEKQLNNKVGVGIQPYFKLPVTDIGYGNVRLKSAGVSLNLNLNLFPKVLKP